MVQSETSVKLPVLALSLARFVTQPMAIISGLLLIDIATSFSTSVGIAGQIRTFAAASEMIFALVMGALAMRFNHKRLLMIGLFFIGLSSIGSTFAPNLFVLTILYSLTGVGVSIISPMTLTMVGDFFSEERRTNIVGLMVAILAASYTIGAPIISRLSANGNWKTSMRFYVFPLACLAFLAIFTIIKDEKTDENASGGYFSGYRVLLSNRSAIACVLGAALYMAAQVIPLSYGSSYIREVVGVSTSIAAIAVITNSFAYILGSLAAGKIIIKLGEKKTALVSVLGMSVFYFFAYSLTNLLVVMLLLVVGYFMGGVMYSTANNLAVGQVSSHRATMMSLFISIIALGNVIGNTVGGFVLDAFGYSSLRFVMVVFGGFCAIVNAYFVHTI